MTLRRRLRWFFVIWITLSTVLNYVDRQTLSILAPVLRDQFHLTNQGYSRIVSAFLLSYTVMYTVGGRFVDWVGERAGMAACIVWWSVATMLHSVATGAFSLAFFRLLLGIGEPANYPAALKTTATWYSKEERGLPIAIYSSGSAVGAILAPPLIAWLVLQYGWRSAFLVPGACGLIWVLVWLRVYHKPVEVADEQSHAREPQALLRLLRNRNVIALSLARFLADPVWYFYLFWIPEYLKRMRGFTLADIGLYGWLPFLAADIGGIVGGLASDRLIRRKHAPMAARRIVLCGSAAIAPIAAFTGLVKSPAVALALIAIGGFVCFVWFINTAALVSDIFPEPIVGSVQGIIGTAGSGAGVLFTLLVGLLTDHGSYVSVFVIAGSMHVLASLALLVLMRSPGSRLMPIESTAA